MSSDAFSINAPHAVRLLVCSLVTWGSLLIWRDMACRLSFAVIPGAALTQPLIQETCQDPTTAGRDREFL